MAQGIANIAKEKIAYTHKPSVNKMCRKRNKSQKNATQIVSKRDRIETRIGQSRCEQGAWAKTGLRKIMNKNFE